MEVKLLSITPDAEKLIEEAGRTCYQSHDKTKEGSDKKMIRSLVKLGHHSVLEHASATFRVSGISRACSHQLVRHRLASYSQKSQRYTPEDGFEYVIPPSVKEDRLIEDDYRLAMIMINSIYMDLIAKGVKKEDARFVLPNACTTEVVMTANFREWRHFIEIRGLNTHAQWEIRKLGLRILDILSEQAPTVFEDLKKKAEE